MLEDMIIQMSEDRNIQMLECRIIQMLEDATIKFKKSKDLITFGIKFYCL